MRTKLWYNRTTGGYCSKNSKRLRSANVHLEGLETIRDTRYNPKMSTFYEMNSQKAVCFQLLFSWSRTKLEASTVLRNSTVLLFLQNGLSIHSVN